MNANMIMNFQESQLATLSSGSTSGSLKKTTEAAKDSGGKDGFSSVLNSVVDSKPKLATDNKKISSENKKNSADNKKLSADEPNKESLQKESQQVSSQDTQLLASVSNVDLQFATVTPIPIVSADTPVVQPDSLKVTDIGSQPTSGKPTGMTGGQGGGQALFQMGMPSDDASIGTDKVQEATPVIKFPKVMESSAQMITTLINKTSSDAEVPIAPSADQQVQSTLPADPKMPITLADQQISKDMQITNKENVINTSKADGSAQNEDVSTILTKLNALLGTPVEKVKSADKFISGKQGKLVADTSMNTSTVSTSNSSNLPPVTQTNVASGAEKQLAVDSLKPVTQDAAKAVIEGEIPEAKTMAAKVDQDVSSSATTPFVTVLESLKKEDISLPSTSVPARPTDPYDVSGQIVSQAKLINTPQNSEMVIKLKPEHLGDLTMKIVVENGAVNATFHSSNAEVRGVIENSLNQLRQEFANQGLKVNYVGVYTSLNQFSSQDQRGNQQQMQGKIKIKRGEGEDFIEAVDALSSTMSASSTTGIDYRI